MGLFESLGGVFDGFLLTTLHASAMVVVVWLVRRVFGHRIPARAYGFAWCLVFMRLAFPVSVATPVSVYQLFEAPIWSESPASMASDRAPDPLVAALSPVSVAKPLGGEAQIAAVGVAAMPPTTTTANSTVSWVFWLWLVGVATIGLLLMRHGFRLLRIVRLSRRINDGRLKHLLFQCTERMSVRRIPDLRTCEHVAEPIMTGTFRPMLLLPEEMATELDDEELKDVFCHELAHIKRGDVALACFASSVLAIHWFNPFVWVALRALQQDRELACDAYVLRMREKGRSGRHYGRTLLRVMELRPTGSLALRGAVPFTGGTGVMKRRIQAMIVGHKERKSHAYLALLAFIGFAFVAMSEPPEAGPIASMVLSQTDQPTAPEQNVVLEHNGAAVCSMLDELAQIGAASDEIHPWPDIWQQWDPVWLESLDLSSDGTSSIRGFGQTGWDVAEFLLRMENGSAGGIVFLQPQINMIADMEHPTLGPGQSFGISSRPRESEMGDAAQTGPELGDVQLWLTDLSALPPQSALDVYDVRTLPTVNQQGQFELNLGGTMSGMRSFCRSAYELEGTADVVQFRWWAGASEPTPGDLDPTGTAYFVIATDPISD